MDIYIPTLGRVGKQLTLGWIPESWRARTFLVVHEDEASQHDYENLEASSGQDRNADREMVYAEF